MNRQKVTVVDVRSPGEFIGGHVSGSINIPIQELPNRINELRDIATPIVLCCASGGRSFSAWQYLRQLGFENIEDGGPWQVVAGQYA